MTKQNVLIFHGLGEPREDLSIEEKPYWISPETFTDIVELIIWRRARGIGSEVIITVDDSNASDLQAADILASHGLVGEFFLLSQRFERRHYLSRSDAQALASMGMIVGTHGHGHVDWRHINDAQLKQELTVARRLIADAIGRPVSRVAIPFGSYDRRVIAALKAEGFDRVYNSDGGPTTSGAYLARRTCVMRRHSIAEIEAILDDRVSMKDKLRRTIAPIVKRMR